MLIASKKNCFHGLQECEFFGFNFLVRNECLILECPVIGVAGTESGDDFVACYRSQEQPGARRWHVTSCRTKPKVGTKNIQIIIIIIFTVFRRGHQLVPGSGRAVWGELMVRCPAPAPPPRARGAAAPPLVWATGPPAGMGAGPGGRGRNLHTPSPPSCVPSSRTQASRQTTRHPTSRNPRVFAPLCSAR